MPISVSTRAISRLAIRFHGTLIRISRILDGFEQLALAALALFDQFRGAFVGRDGRTRRAGQVTGTGNGAASAGRLFERLVGKTFGGYGCIDIFVGCESAGRT